MLHSGREARKEFSGPKLPDHQEDAENSELPLFDMETLAAATGGFSESNKLGEGGFGLVYKGRLPGGEEVAVKRLSRSSGQGCEEFKNEVILISKLQHRNLVRILGCCIQGAEKMLVYEYMPNKSLDAFLFGTYSSTLLLVHLALCLASSEPLTTMCSHQIRRGEGSWTGRRGCTSSKGSQGGSCTSTGTRGSASCTAISRPATSSWTTT
jgi:hypothetical protein